MAFVILSGIFPLRNCPLPPSCLAANCEKILRIQATIRKPENQKTCFRSFSQWIQSNPLPPQRTNAAKDYEDHLGTPPNLVFSLISTISRNGSSRVLIFLIFGILWPFLSQIFSDFGPKFGPKRVIKCKINQKSQKSVTPVPRYC